MNLNKTFILLICICFFSCKKTLNKKNDSEYIAKTETIVKTWINKKMDLPTDSIEFLNNPYNHKNTVEYTSQPLKIVVTVDGDCSACLGSFTYWQTFLKKLSAQKLNCKIYFFVEGYDKDNLEEVIKKLGLDYNCFYDKDSKFRKNNKLFDKRFQAALLDKDNKVILIGNPVLNEDLGDLYFMTLEELNEN